MSLAHQSLIIILFTLMLLVTPCIAFILNSYQRPTPIIGILIIILPVSALAIAYIIVCDYGAEIRRLRETMGLNPVDGQPTTEETEEIEEQQGELN